MDDDEADAVFKGLDYVVQRFITRREFVLVTLRVWDELRGLSRTLQDFSAVTKAFKYACTACCCPFLQSPCSGFMVVLVYPCNHALPTMSPRFLSTSLYLLAMLIAVFVAYEVSVYLRKCTRHLLLVAPFAFPRCPSWMWWFQWGPSLWQYRLLWEAALKRW